MCTDVEWCIPQIKVPDEVGESESEHPLFNDERNFNASMDVFIVAPNVWNRMQGRRVWEIENKAGIQLYKYNFGDGEYMMTYASLLVWLQKIHDWLLINRSLTSFLWKTSHSNPSSEVHNMFGLNILFNFLHSITFTLSA